MCVSYNTNNSNNIQSDQSSYDLKYVKNEYKKIMYFSQQPGDNEIIIQNPLLSNYCDQIDKNK